MINNKFLNFKTYNGFLAKKDQIANDSIVFIQDKSCIWARGKEYVCDGPYDASIDDNELQFKNKNGKVVFTISYADNTLTVKDSNDYTFSIEYVSKDQLEEFKREIRNSISDSAGAKIDASILPTLARKSDLDAKADTSLLDDYVTKGSLNNSLNNKLDKLYAGYGIAINDNYIDVTLDTKLFVIVDELPETNIDENKIYILQQVVDGELQYVEYRRINGEWRQIGTRQIDVDLTGYYTKLEADDRYLIPEDTYLTPALAQQTYQPKRNDYVISGDLSELLTTINSEYQEKGDYALKQEVASDISRLERYIASKYVLKDDVYTPKNGIISVDDPTTTPSTGGSTGGSSTGTSGGGSGSGYTAVDIAVDGALSKSSSNPVQNKVVTRALDTKLDKSAYVVDLELDDESINPIANSVVKFAIDTVEGKIPSLAGYVKQNALLQYYTKEYSDITYATKAQVATKADASALNNYATVEQLNSKVDFATLASYATTVQLAGKLNNLIAGNGITIQDDVISTNLDTKVFVVVDALPTGNDINRDKIYIYQGSLYKWNTSDNDWQIIGQANPEIDLTPYALTEDLDDYVHKLSVYYPSGNIPYTPEGQVGYEEALHLIDTNIDSSSVNPIQNKAVADALALKANAADVSSTYATKQALADQHTIAESTYATKAEVQTALNTKQSNLTAGTGISIQNGVISSTLDTNLYVIVSELPTVDFDTSKIYILETQNQDGSYDYTAYKYRSQSSGDNEISNLAYGWFPIGITPDVDLSGLATTSDLTTLRTLVYSNDQKATNQVQAIQRVIDNLSNLYQPKSSSDDYVKSSELDKYKTSLSGLTEDKILQLMEYLHMRLNWIQEKIAQQYVLKTDVDPETLRHWGTAETYEFDVNEATQGPTFVTMSKARYDYLVQMNQVSKNTYYFTYEGDEPAGDTWQFGGTFPIVLTDNWAFGGTFPIKLK